MLQKLMDMLCTVHSYHNPLTLSAVEVGNVTQYTLGGLVPGNIIQYHSESISGPTGT